MCIRHAGRNRLHSGQTRLINLARRGTENRTRQSGLMRAGSARAVPRSWGDGRDSNPLIARFTTWCIDHFCFRQRRRPGNRTLSRLCVGQLLAIELDAVALRATGETRTHSDGIKSPEPVLSGASRMESCGVELNHRISSLSARCLHQTWPPQAGRPSPIRTEPSSSSHSRAGSNHAHGRWSRWRESNPRHHVGSVRPCHWATSTWSVTSRIELPTAPWQGAVLPLHHGHVETPAGFEPA